MLLHDGSSNAPERIAALPVIINGARYCFGELDAGGNVVSTDDGFVDVAAGSTHEVDIECIAVTGITRGGDPPVKDPFCPRDPVTREQTPFLVRALLSG